MHHVYFHAKYFILTVTIQSVLSISLMAMNFDLRKQLWKGIDSKNIHMIKKVLSSQVDQDYANTLLKDAIYRGEWQTASLLVESGIDVNCVDTNGRSPLYYAMDREFSNRDFIVKLINAGANPNKMMGQDCNPLALAVARKNKAFIYILLLVGAKPGPAKEYINFHIKKHAENLSKFKKGEGLYEIYEDVMNALEKELTLLLACAIKRVNNWKKNQSVELYSLAKTKLAQEKKGKEFFEYWKQIPKPIKSQILTFFVNSYRIKPISILKDKINILIKRR